LADDLVDTKDTLPDTIVGHRVASRFADGIASGQSLTHGLMKTAFIIGQ